MAEKKVKRIGFRPTGKSLWKEYPREERVRFNFLDCRKVPGLLHAGRPCHVLSM